MFETSCFILHCSALDLVVIRNGFIHYYPPSSDESNVLETSDSLSDENELQFLLTGKAASFGPKLLDRTFIVQLIEL